MNFKECGNDICNLFQIDYPIIQGGMVWVSGAKLAAAVSNAGGLGLIGAGSMKPELLKEHLKKAQDLLDDGKHIGVNVPLLYRLAEEQIQVCLDAGIKIFFTSAGSPKKYTKFLKEKGCTVVHVTSSPLLAKKCEDAGVDAIVAEGFEAGGHNGRDEITTMCLIPQVCDTVRIPVIAAGGIFDVRTIKAALCLGASGVQLGTRFLMTKESSAHQNYKDKIITAGPGDTRLQMKPHVPVRLLNNKFATESLKLELECAPVEKLIEHLGKGRAKLGMLDGDVDEGELEVGQASGAISDLPSVSELMQELSAVFTTP